MRLALKNDSLCALDFQLLQFSFLTLMKWASFNPALLAFFSTSVVKRTSKQRLLLSVVGKAFFQLKVELDRIVDRYFETLQQNNAKTFTMLRQIVIGGSLRLCEKKFATNFFACKEAIFFVKTNTTHELYWRSACCPLFE